MGFSNIVSQVVLFMSILIVVVVLSLVYKTYITTTNLSLKTQNDRVLSKIETSFSISSATYNGTAEKISVEMSNNGAAKLDPGYVDVFVDNKRISRDSPGRESGVSERSNLINRNLWDPGETLLINVTHALQPGVHIIRVGVENGITRSAMIEVQ